MSVLSAVQSAAIRLSQGKPNSLFSTTVTFNLEMADLANETAVAIAKEHDWQALTKLCTLTGDGSKIAFDLPSDYDRMPIKQAVHSATWEQWRYERARDLDEWQDLQTFIGAGVPGWWIILSDQMNIYPAVATGDQAKFYYISNQISGTKAAFTADTDNFILSERLLTLGLIWRWRSQKRAEYAEDMRNYEIALAQEIGRDKGARIIASGAPRYRGDIRYSYPGRLG